MAVVFGDNQKGDWIRVTCIQYEMEEHPNGYTIKASDVPEYPFKKPGKSSVMLFNVNTKEWKFDDVDAPYTQEEALLEIASALREIAKAINNK